MRNNGYNGETEILEANYINYNNGIKCILSTEAAAVVELSRSKLKFKHNQEKF